MSATAPAATGAPAPLRILLRAGLIETVRRREFHVLLIFMAIYLCGIGVAAVVGVENAATATFLLNLGLELALGLSLLAAVLTGARQIPDDLENRTMYPLLAKPLGRGQYLVGRVLGAWLAGVLALAPLFLLGWAPVMLLVPTAHVETTSPALLVQMLVLQVAALGVAAALATLLSLWAPKGVVVVLMLLVVLQGDTLGSMAAAHLGEGLLGSSFHWLAGLLPNFDVLRLTTAYTDGSPPLGAVSFLLRVAYAAVFGCAATVAAAATFRGRPL